MKDTSNTTTHLKRDRPTAYPKKRPLPADGVVKHKSSPVTVASVIVGLSCKLAVNDTKIPPLVIQQAKPDWMLEPHYRNEVLEYMHDMEVSLPPNSSSSSCLDSRE